MTRTEAMRDLLDRWQESGLSLMAVWCRHHEHRDAVAGIAECPDRDTESSKARIGRLVVSAKLVFVGGSRHLQRDVGDAHAGGRGPGPEVETTRVDGSPEVDQI